MSIDIKRLQTVKQLASSGSPYSESALRWLVFNAEENGLSKAIIRIGRKVLIDVEAFSAWIEEHRQNPAIQGGK